jgi:hypothetical protein
MRDITDQAARFLGYVQLQVGAKVFALPVQAVPLKKADGSTQPGGFFTEDSGQWGIIVDSEATPEGVEEQIQRASEDAVRHISKKYLN